MPGPGNERAAAGGDRLRTPYLDRDTVIEVLKIAFVQDRLRKEELDARVGRAFTARTYGELAALIADIPAGLVAGLPPGKPARAPAESAVTVGMVVATTVLAAAAWTGALIHGGDEGLLVMLVFVATFVWLGTVILSGVTIVEARHDRRASGAPPPGPDGS